MPHSLEQARLHRSALSIRLAAFAALVALALTSCTLALSRTHDQCSTSRDCQAVELGAVCTDQGVCKSVMSTASTAPAHAQPCQHDADCTDPSALCRQGGCKSLIADGCVGLGVADATDERERLPVAVLTAHEDLLATPLGPVPAAVLLAVTEINAQRSAGALLPRVIAVACDETNTDALHDLIASGVRVVVGPTRSDLLAPTSDAALNEAVLFAPFADAPLFEIMQAPTRTSSIVSCKPNRRESEASLLSAVDFMRAYIARAQAPAAGDSAVVALTQTENQLGFADLFRPSELTPHGAQALTFDPKKDDLGTALAALPAVPGLVVGASTEADWSQNVLSVERSLSDHLPYYLLSDKQSDVLNLLLHDGQRVSPQDQRTFGLDNHLEAANLSAREQFVSAFVAATGGDPPRGTEYAYDCTYLGIYAAYAGLLRYSLSPDQLSPGAVLMGLSGFNEHGMPLSVGAADVALALATLQRPVSSQRAIRLLGSSGNVGDLQSLPGAFGVVSDTSTVYVQPTPRAKELYCIDRKNSQFCDTGLIFPVSGAQPAPTEGACSCMPM